MRIAREAATFELRGPFGRRVVGVAGGRGELADVDKSIQKLAAVDRADGTTSQVFNAIRVAGVEHIVHAVRSALIAYSTKRSFSSSLKIELVCWTAAERHISRAFEKVGLKQGGKELAFVVIGISKTQVKAAMTRIFRELAVERDDTVLGLNRDKFSILQRTFSISSKELSVAPLQKLVIERIALLPLAK